MSNPEPSHRRLDVQGLRALAVLMVVAFHTGLALPGGFVGVDVFFVISGFVITGMLRREYAETGRLRLGAFYLRRFKRLTPALAVVVALTAIASSFILSPLGAQQHAAQTGLGAMLLVANGVIASSTGGYFDAPAETNPLLHTWSLSVEEQFYIVFPALLLAGWFAARRLRRLVHAPALLVGLVAVVSFVLADIGSTGYASSWLLGFYSPLTRAWEFALGALLALVVAGFRPLASRAALTFALLGGGMLVASVVVITGSTPFPGSWTLLPVTGTLLLLLAGAQSRNAVTRALGSRPLVAVGNASYSIYLWHWPFIVFASLLWPTASHAILLAALLSLLPAAASYRWVEQPLRKAHGLMRPRLVSFVAVVVLAPVVVAAGVGTMATDYWTPRYEAGGVAIANDGDIGQDEWLRYLRDTFYPCTPDELHDRAPRWEGVVRCQQSRPGPDVTIALIGDSHAEHLFLGLAEVLPEQNVAYYIRNDGLSPANPDVAQIVKHVAASPSIEAVVVSALWNLRGVHAHELSTTLRTISEAGKTVFVTDDVPYFPFDAFGCKYRQALLLPTDCSMDTMRFRREYAQYYPELRATMALVPQAHLLETARYFCDESSCDMARHGRLLFRDRSHLNLNGSRFLAGRLVNDHPELVAAFAQAR
jgi:peptidoglycan/LPS O-acetylase OafA/YrhL